MPPDVHVGTASIGCPARPCRADFMRTTVELRSTGQPRAALPIWALPGHVKVKTSIGYLVHRGCSRDLQSAHSSLVTRTPACVNNCLYVPSNQQHRYRG